MVAELTKEEIVARWVEDWCLFAEEAIGVTLDDEQKQILRSVQHNPKTAVVSGTARGKDFITAIACVCFLYLMPGMADDAGKPESTKVAMTAPTDRQIKNIMQPEMANVYNRLKTNGIAPYSAYLTGYDIRTDFEDYFLTGFKADEHNHEAWSGFHAVNVMFAVTEASGISETIFNAIEGNLQGNSRLLIVFNNNSGTGYAATALKRPGWKKFRLDSLNAPNVIEKRMVIPGQVDWGWVNNRVNEWATIIAPSDYLEEEGDFYWENEKGKHCYRPNDLFRVKVRGMSPKVSSGALIPSEWIDAANKRWQEQQLHKWEITKPLRLGNDVAGMGRDSTCFCYRYGHYVEKFEMIHSGGTANHMEVCGRGVTITKTNTDSFIGRYAQWFIDTIGEGAGVYSRAIELSQQKNHEWLKNRVFSVKFSESADWNGNDLKDITGQYTFLNMRAYLFWCVRDWLNPANKTNAMLPPDDEFTQEATEIRWKFRSDGSIQIEEKEEIKKRLGRSIDKFDALANTFYPVNDVDPSPKKKSTIKGLFH